MERWYLQVHNSSPEAFDVSSYKNKIEFEKKLVEELRAEWKLLWTERFSDKVRAEDISLSHYETLQIDRGTVIFAIRDFKPLNFKEILEQQKIENPDRFVQPNVNVGGWHKFIRTQVPIQKKPLNKPATSLIPEKPIARQIKKNGRGWLHSI